ncbi:MAG: DUF1571 domain-containing protein [Planctomycetia bacterium]
MKHQRRPRRSAHHPSTPFAVLVVLSVAVGCAGSRGQTQARLPTPSAPPPPASSVDVPTNAPQPNHTPAYLPPALAVDPAIAMNNATPTIPKAVASDDAVQAVGGATETGDTIRPASSTIQLPPDFGGRRTKRRSAPDPEPTPPDATPTTDDPAAQRPATLPEGIAPAEPFGLPITAATPMLAWPASVATTAENLVVTRKVMDAARQFFVDTPSYTCRMIREDGPKAKQEIMLMRFRSQPRSVFYQWLDDRNAGRECVWVDGRNRGMLTTRGGKGDFFFVGKRIEVDPLGALARARSKYPITESGLDRMVARLDNAFKRIETGEASLGTLIYRGTTRRPEYDEPLVHLVQDVPPKADAALPAGAVRDWYFEADTARLALMVTKDRKGQQIEYFCMDRFVADPTLGDDDFDPDRLWPGAKSMGGPKTAAKDGPLTK